jgi:thiol-disulfide isomerase/thioredoxin
MRMPRPIAIILTVIALAIGCGADPGQSAGDSAQPPSESTSATADLGFTAKTVTGETFDGTQLAGRPTVLWFWAPWCPTCRAQEPTVKALAEKYAGRVNFVGVGGLDEAEAIREHGATLAAFPQLNDPDGAIWKRFRITAQSSYVLIDGNGKVLDRGYIDNDELARRVEQMAG